MEAGVRCSFCNLPASERPARLTTGGGASACGPCVEVALEVLEIDAREPECRPPPPDGGEARTGWLACAFCGRRSTEVHKLVAGPTIAICDGCLRGVAA